MTHLSEAEFEDAIAKWYRKHCKAINADTQVYQPEPRWFPDLIVDRPDLTIYAEIENDAASIRSGVGQALGYVGGDLVKGVPMVIFPKGHKDDVRVHRLRLGSRCLLRAFDAENMAWVQPS